MGNGGPIWSCSGSSSALGGRKPRLGVPLNSQVIPGAGLAEPRSSSVKWTSLMVPKALSHLYEKQIPAKGNGDFLPQYPCM